MKIGEEIKKSCHFVSMFFKVAGRDGFSIAIGRMMDTLLIAASQSEKKLKQCEEELYATKNTDIGRIVFEEAGTKNNSVVYGKAHVDVIVCVHNALEDVQKCLASVLQYSGDDYTLILVDDGSVEETRVFLADFAKKNGVKLLRNENALGYTFAANIGLRNSTGDYAVLLNSDTIVTSNWLEKMIRCAQSDSKIGLVGPLSNTASWQSVPKTSIDGDWAENVLPENIDIQKWANLIAQDSQRIYPKIPFLNGFCLMIKKELIEDIGIFDEEHFGKGYGEENDYCLRARKKGWSLAIADDVYIFHSQSKSYSSEKRKILCENADRFLIQKHGKEIIQAGVNYCKDNRILDAVRARIETIPKRFSLSRQKNFKGKTIAFILPVTNAGGGGNIVINEAMSLTAFGVEVTLFNLLENKKRFEESHPYLALNVIYAKDEVEVSGMVEKYDAVVATASFTVAWLLPLARKETPILGYYSQDYEPFFYAQNTKAFKNARKSYEMVPRMKIFTKTDWNKKLIEENHKRKVNMVGPSYQSSLFYPRPRKISISQDVVRVVAMIRPSSPRRAAKMTMEILKKAKQKFGNKVEILIFGLEQKELHSSSIEKDFDFRNLGLLSSAQVSRLFNESDVFVDFSIFQAMGLAAMEAMASGLAVIVPQEGGSHLFAIDKVNALIVDTANKDTCQRALFEVIDNSHLRNAMGRRALKDMPQYHPDFSASKLANILFN